MKCSGPFTWVVTERRLACKPFSSTREPHCFHQGKMAVLHPNPLPLLGSFLVPLAAIWSRSGERMMGATPGPRLQSSNKTQMKLESWRGRNVSLSSPKWQESHPLTRSSLWMMPGQGLLYLIHGTCWPREWQQRQQLEGCSHHPDGRCQSFAVCVCVCVRVCVCVPVLSCSVMSNSLWPYGLLPARLLCSWDFPGKNTGVGCHFLLQGYFKPRDQTHVSCVSCTGRWILHHWALWEAPVGQCQRRQQGQVGAEIQQTELEFRQSLRLIEIEGGKGDWVENGSLLKP